MAKRKKYPKLPNGYGSIRYLGKGRRNPYAVHPPVTEFDENGKAKLPRPICYVDNWMKGFAVLTSYKAGTYVPGMENNLNIDASANSDVINQILADYARVTHRDPKRQKTFAQVYEEFFAYKFERDKSREYSKSTILTTRAAFKNCAVLHNRPFAELRHADLQAVVDNCPLRHASLELIVSLFHQMYAYADIHGLCDKDYSAHVKINVPNDDVHGEAFSVTELQTIYKHVDIPTAEMIIIMCYSGFRIAEYVNLRVDLDTGYFQGGLKTKAGKDRIVPIHSRIAPLVEKRLHRDGKMLAVGVNTFRNDMYHFLTATGIAKHTPHDCRHTFSMLCEKFGVTENDRKRMLGHSFGGDITNGIYGHRSVEDLRNEIEKITLDL